MQDESSKHFKLATVKQGALVLEKKTGTTIPYCKAQLPLPHPTCLLIAAVGGQCLIGMAHGEVGHAKVELSLFK
jgi:hypothetical protein